MPVKKRNFFLNKEGYRIEKETIIRGTDGVDYFVVDLIVSEYGTPKHPYPHLMVIRNDARLVGSAERHPPEFFKAQWRQPD